MDEENKELNPADAAKKALGTAVALKNAKRNVKIACIVGIALFIVLLIAIIVNFIQIIFTALGYDSSSDYVTDSVAIEEELLEEGIKDVFSYTDMQELFDAAMFRYDGTKYSVTGMELPSGGTGASGYASIEKDYVTEVNSNTDETVIYDGYTVENAYDGFWSGGEYVTYLVPIAQSKLSTKDIKYLMDYEEKKKNEGKYKKRIRKIVKKLADEADEYDWFAVTELDDTVTTTAVSGSNDENSSSDNPFYNTGGSEVELDEFIDGTDSGTDAGMIVITHITKNYAINLLEESKFSISAEDYSYKPVVDEDTLDMVHNMLEDLQDGNILNAGADLVKGLWNKIKKIFQKSYSWREMVTYNDNGNSGGTSDGSYIPVQNINIPEGQEGNMLLLGALVKAESGNQPYEGQVAVAYVVLNRMAKYNADMRSVIFADGQFACTWDGNFNRAMTTLNAMSAEQLKQDTSYNAAAAALTGQIPSPVSDWCYFMNPSEASKKRIQAHNSSGEIKIIGAHWFYKNW